MGHYLSEVEAPAEARARAVKSDRIADLLQRGYEFTNQAGGDITPNGSRAMRLVHHTPCGAAVFDTDRHDQVCLALKRPLLQRAMDLLRR